MPSSLILPRFSQVDAYGNPLVGGRLYTYANTTTTPQVTYRDAAGATANTNPIILDALGSAVIFLKEGLVYTFVMRDSNDALLWSQDSISAAQSGASGIMPVMNLPTTDVGPVYMPGQGAFYWNGSQYVSDYSGGFAGGPYAFKNKVINGDFRVWQLGTSIGPITSASSNPYTADQWKASIAGTASVTVVQQPASADFGQGRTGAFTARITSNAAASPAVGDKNRFAQPIEGQSILSFAMGAVWGGKITLSFWVKASIVGEYSVALLNGGSPGFRAYVTTFSVATAGAWEQKKITVPVDQSGVANWSRDNSLGMSLVFDLGSGTNAEAARDTWISTESTRIVGTVRLVGTSGATLEFGQVQLEFGAQATPFEDMPAQALLAQCQRFYERVGESVGCPSFSGYSASGVNIVTYVPWKVTKRATPTVSRNGTWLVSNVNQPSVDSPSVYGTRVLAAMLSAGNWTFEPNSSDDYFAADARY